MNIDPQKFFIGLMDFFSILLPGALLTWLFMVEAGPVVMGDRYAMLEGAQAWVAFLFASYLFGHLIFLLGSWLDEFYDWARRYTLNAQITRLACRGRPLPWFARVLIWMVFKRERDLAVECASAIRKHALGPLLAQNAINTFQWCKALLSVESSTSLALVQRFEADSKFFRCFAFVLLLLLIGWHWQYQWPLSGIPVVLLLLLLAFWRYMEQRHKATNQAYWSVITLTAKNGKVAFEKPTAKSAAPTHAGGVVFRLRGGVAEYLLFEATKDPAQWVLPKGYVEDGEHHREAAVREVYEESGTWAQIVCDLSDATWSVEGCPVTTRFYLMRAIGRGLRLGKDRRQQWLTLADATAKANHNETRELLKAAEQLRVAEMSRRSQPLNRIPHTT